MSEEPRGYCPVCAPSTDPVTDFVIVAHCTEHTPSLAGTGDHLANPLATPMPAIYEGGEDGGAWCAVIHGGRRHDA